MKIVLDTNILISAVLSTSYPREIFLMAVRKKVLGVTSPYLLAKLEDILNKKFSLDKKSIDNLLHLIRKRFLVISPKFEIKILKDKPNNRVLEAAVEGGCDYVITGNKAILELKKYRGIGSIYSYGFKLHGRLLHWR